ncbi:MAG: hypothetical protein AAF267_05960 [Deinococcota bacterium]
MNPFGNRFGKWGIKASRFLLTINRRHLILRGKLGVTYLNVPLSIAIPLGLFVLIESPVTILLVVVFVLAFGVQASVTQ